MLAVAKMPRYPGYTDASGRFVPFSMADEVFERARSLGTRILLRLELNENNELEGMLYTNDRGLSMN
ncbi:MAG: hypothetical protein KJO38_04490 [Gammaproteobacteria bacterium]|nr:hypothetical protein [Gammaproteobacteria bacterium]